MMNDPELVLMRCAGCKQVAERWLSMSLCGAGRNDVVEAKPYPYCRSCDLACEIVDRSEWLEYFLFARPQYREHVDLMVLPPTIQEVIEEFPEAEGEIDLVYGEMRFAPGCHDGHGHGLTMLALYVLARRNMATHGFAMMLALQRPPGIETNDTFWAGRKRFDQVFGEEYANRIKAGLAKKGINLKNGDEYCPELVRPGMGYGPKNPDPQAIIPAGEGRDYVKRICEKRGWACSGAVTVKEREPLTDPYAPENCVPLAPKLVDQLAIAECRKNPDLQRKTKRELREMVKEKHGPSR